MIIRALKLNSRPMCEHKIKAIKVDEIGGHEDSKIEINLSSISSASRAQFCPSYSSAKPQRNSRKGLEGNRAERACKPDRRRLDFLHFLSTVEFSRLQKDASCPLVPAAIKFDSNLFKYLQRRFVHIAGLYEQEQFWLCDELMIY